MANRTTNHNTILSAGRLAAGILTPAVVMLAIACGNGNGNAAQPDSPGASPQGGAAAGPDGREGATTSTAGERGGRSGEGGVIITVSQGRVAGTHNVAGETLCVFANGTWIASYSDYPTLETQAAINGIGRDGGKSQDFQYTAVFGDVGDEANPGTMITVAPQIARDAEASVTLSRGTAEISAQGVLEDGTRVTARFRCTEVER